MSHYYQQEEPIHNDYDESILFKQKQLEEHIAKLNNEKEMLTNALIYLKEMFEHICLEHLNKVFVDQSQSKEKKSKETNQIEKEMKEDSNKYRFCKETSNLLVKFYNMNKYPTRIELENIELRTGLNQRQIVNWFNRRRLARQENMKKYKKS